MQACQADRFDSLIREVDTQLQGEHLAGEDPGGATERIRRTGRQLTRRPALRQEVLDRECATEGELVRAADRNRTVGAVHGGEVRLQQSAGVATVGRGSPAT